MDTKRRSAWGLGIEVALWSVGAASLLFGCVTLGRASLSRQEGLELVRSLPQRETAADAVAPGGQPAQPRVEGTVEAQLEIPAIGLATPILTGCTAETLRRGACRLMGTAVAGGLGNMAVAGHRDTTFRPLEKVRTGELATVVDKSGRYQYIVSQTEIVSPQEVRVLDVGARPELTLITCYPFRYIGAAPQRFVVHAYLRSVDGLAQ